MEFIKNSSIYRIYLPLFIVLLGTGLRIGEALALDWHDIDFAENTLYVRRTLIYKPLKGHYAFHISSPKTPRAVRMIPLLTDVKEALAEEKKRQSERNTVPKAGFESFVFLSRTGNPRTPGTVNELIKRICKAYNKAEEEKARGKGGASKHIRPFSPHDLRHTFCTRFCENETNIKLIQEIMGHSDIATTMNIYAEISDQKKQEAFSNLEGKLKIR